MLWKYCTQYANKFRKLSNGHRTGKGQFLFQSQRKAMPENVQTTTSECQRTDALELCCWRRLLRIPWTARTSNQSILKEICPEYSLEGLMLKLKPQYFGHLMWRTDSFEKTLMLGKIEGRKRRGRQRIASPTQWTWVWVDSGSWWWTGRPGVLWFMGSQRVGHDWATELTYWLIICNS